MATETCEMRIVRSADGVTWDFRVQADLEDVDQLQDLLVTNARRVDNKDDGTRWAPGYQAEFRPLERPYELVIVGGINRDDD